MLAAAGCSSESDSATPDSDWAATFTVAPDAGPDTLVVDVAADVGPINRNLSGIHAKASAESIASDFDDLAPMTHRHVMSAADFLHYDCETATVDEASLDYFNDWLDAVDAEGAEAILSLSYVPECIARDGQPKGPTTDGVAYRQFLDALLDALVTQRQSDGRRPLERFELWNEPDIPVAPGDPGS